VVEQSGRSYGVKGACGQLQAHDAAAVGVLTLVGYFVSLLLFLDTSWFTLGMFLRSPTLMTPSCSTSSGKR
jgi:hypothetical protein